MSLRQLRLVLAIILHNAISGILNALVSCIAHVEVKEFNFYCMYMCITYSTYEHM